MESISYIGQVGDNIYGTWDCLEILFLLPN